MIFGEKYYGMLKKTLSMETEFVFISLSSKTIS